MGPGSMSGGPRTGVVAIARNLELNRDNQARKRAYLHGLKQQPCMRCGGEFPPICMDFHHRPGTKKKFHPGKGVSCRGWDALRSEVAKCDVLCANCHRLEHARV